MSPTIRRRAQMRYLSMRAMLEADHAKLDRTQTLFGMGARDQADRLREVPTYRDAPNMLGAAAPSQIA